MENHHSKPISLFVNAYKENRPFVLIAGQSFCSMDEKKDYILDLLFEHKRIASSDQKGWRSILSSDFTYADFEWLAQRFKNQVPSSSAITAFNFLWSAVFTSTIDPWFSSRFTTRGRKPENIVSRNTIPPNARSRFKPPLFFLFSKIGELQSNPEYQVPTNHATLSVRFAQHGNALLNRLPETVTAKGIIVLAGYDPFTDWLKLDDLLSILYQQSGLKILWFGKTQEEALATGSDLVKEMIKDGSLQIISESLGSVLYNQIREGSIDFEELAAPDEPGLITFDGGVINITPEMRLRVGASAFMVEDDWTYPPEEYANKQKEQEAFHRFHGNFDNFKSRVEGIAQGFAIQRIFEGDLWRELDLSSFKQLKSFGKVLILHGQSGTGKSIALSSLISKIRIELQLPVLVASDRIANYEGVEFFCEQIEKAGAKGAVLINDANLSPQKYIELAETVQSRGRRLLLIGTSYRQKNVPKTSKTYIEAPAKLAPEEFKKLTECLQRFYPHDTETFEAADKDHILAFLYRYLPSSRFKLTDGLNKEAQDVDQVVKHFLTTITHDKIAHSTLSYALEKAGFFSDARTNDTINDNLRLAADNLVDYVMVAGRLGTPIPFNLLVRVMREKIGSIYSINNILELLSSLDLFRWPEIDAEGTDVLIGPRLRLEADIICRQRIGSGSDREIELLVDLIRNTHPVGFSGQTERKFLLDLLARLGKDGPDGGRFKSGYLEFAAALQHLRLHKGVHDVGLMLQESVFLRRKVWSEDDPQKNISDFERQENFKYLAEASKVISEALQIIQKGQSPVSARTKNSLLGEQATIYGFLSKQAASKNDSREEAWNYYLASKQASRDAQSKDPSYYPLDIELWTAYDLLSIDDLDEGKRLELVADLYETLEQAQSEISSFTQDQLGRFLTRRYKIANLLQNTKLTSRALKELEDHSPAIAVYLTAREIAKPLESSWLRNNASKVQEFDDRLKQVAAQTVDFISEKSKQYPVIDNDLHCLRLKFRLMWLDVTGERLWSNTQLGHCPGKPEDIKSLLDIILRINSILAPSTRNTERFLEAVLSWLYKDYQYAERIWADLSTETDLVDRTRTRRRLIACDEDGNPLRFTGRVKPPSRVGSDSWIVSINELDKEIRLYGRDYPNELYDGKEEQNMGVAFNYIGPIIEPLS